MENDTIDYVAEEYSSSSEIISSITKLEKVFVIKNKLSRFRQTGRIFCKIL